ncbi:MAG: VWA domain-containing protein [Woeseiaceae bacterium]
MRRLKPLFLSILLCGAAVGGAHAAELQVEIQSPTADHVPVDGETMVDVEGVASTIGGVKYIDMMFVMDTSSSLRKSDPQDYRSVGAIGLVRGLSPRSDTKIGVVSFSGSGDLVQPMTADRDKVVEAIENLPRSGSTDLAAGIQTALDELERNGRPGSSRVIMLFTDGMSNRMKTYDATAEAQMQGVAIQSLMLGTDEAGGKTLEAIAWATAGGFKRVTDPAKLPEEFLNLRTTGVGSVTLSVNGSDPVPAKLTAGTFSGRLPLVTGDNRIVAVATSLDGQTKESIVNVEIRDASCAALEVAAMKSGRPVISLDDRSVEIVVDASRSMWGRMHGQPKMAVAKDILHDVSYWYPDDLDLALRAYGSTSPSESNNCADSTLLVPFGEHNRESIRQAVARLRPTGQTPIAYSLHQAAADFGSLDTDRALVLVTDGIESCGGDPVAAARALRERGIVVHLIGFGLGNAADEDTANLYAVANASGGRYVTAGSAEELKDALTRTVATSFTVYYQGSVVANGSLGSNESIVLPAGDYKVVLDSSPPREVNVSLAPRDRLTVTLEKQGDYVTHAEQREVVEHQSCDADPVSLVNN